MNSRENSVNVFRRYLSLVLFAGLMGSCLPGEAFPASARQPKKAEAKLSAPVFKSPLARLELKDGDSIVFLGDSITHQCLYTQYVENYFYMRFPGLRLKTHNAGVGGAKAWDALQRFDRDVAAYKPKYVTILLGMNDGRYRPFDKETFNTYRKDMTELLARIRKIGAVPVLITPTMFDSRAARLRPRRRPPNEETLRQYNAVLAYYGAWLREVAVDEGYGFVDMYSRLNTATLTARKSDPKFTLIPDAVHPGPDGQLVMAYSIVRDVLPVTGVSSIFVGISSKGKVTSQFAGGKLTGLKKTAEGLEFTFLANQLPWVMPAEARRGVQLLRLPLTLNRERLQVIGLKRGMYELSIDGQVVGTYSTAQLFRGLPLHSNTKTPQYQQALHIAELNKKRNDGPVKSLRNEWRIFQAYARLKRQLAAAPGNEKLQQQVTALKKRLEGLEERIQQHEKAAAEIEEQIFRINKPKARKYVLKKVSLTRLDR